MLGALGAGIDNSDNTPDERNPFKRLNPPLSRSGYLVKYDLIVLPAYRGYIYMLACEHDAFDHSLSAVNASSVLRQELVTFLNSIVPIR